MTLTCTGFAFIVAQLTCTSPEIQVDAARFCRTYQPVTYSMKDTPQTRQQVRRENAKWKALCASGQP